MCGNGKCVYYGCDTCLKTPDGDVLRMHREECACLNEWWYEFCSSACLTRFLTDIEGECECGTTSFQIASGPSRK